MSNTVHRFESGVHPVAECPSNKSGYAATKSASSMYDLHILDFNSFLASPPTQSKSKKTTFATIDKFIYMFAESVYRSTLLGLHIIMFSKPSVITNTLNDMITSLSGLYTRVIVITQDDYRFDVQLYFDDYSISSSYDSFDSLSQFISSCSFTSVSSVAIWPTPTEELKRIVNVIKPSKWYTLISKSVVYVPRDSSTGYNYNAYPWSSSNLCQGFVQGTETITDGSLRDRHKYIGSFYFYENMISQSSIGHECIDCARLKFVSLLIRSLTGQQEVSRSRQYSEASLEALEYLDRLLSEASSSTTS